MQQYFSDIDFKENDEVLLDADTLYHLKKVLRKDENYTFRLVNKNHEIYKGHLTSNNTFLAIEKLDENNELDVDITCVLALIKSDKFELCIQKLVELGVKRIVPYNACRSVMKIKKDSKLDRFQKIIKEAAEQSHRNIIPEICEPCGIKDLEKYKSDLNYICYESKECLDLNIDVNNSITYIIGPEGGFDEEEYKKITEIGYKPISLGKRILRAETAAIYATSVIVSKCQ